MKLTIVWLTPKLSDIFLHQSFLPYIDRKFSIQPIDLIFTATQQNAWKEDMEPIRPLHEPWIELSQDDDITWTPGGEDSYTGSSGGGLAQPNVGMAETARTASILADLLLFIVPLTFFQAVAKYTKKYCYQDWVVEKFAKRRDGSTKEVRHFIDVPRNLHGTPYTGRRHRANKERKKYKITTKYIIYWYDTRYVHFYAAIHPLL